MLSMSPMFRLMFRSMAVEVEAPVSPAPRVSEVQSVLLDLRAILVLRVTTASVAQAALKVFLVPPGNEVFRGLLALLEKTERMVSSALRALLVLLDPKAPRDLPERLVLPENEAP